MKTVHRFDVSAAGEVVRFDVSADAFLHHMVRNIVGALVAVGAGKVPPGWIAELLAARDRTCGPPTFAPDGLYFVGADYDAAFALPPTRRDIALARRLTPCAPGSRSAASRASRTASPRHARAPTRSASCSGAVRRASSSTAARGTSSRRCRRSCSTVGLFVDPSADEVRAALAAVPLDMLQFHGSEPASFCRAFGRPYLKAIPMAPGTDLLESLSSYGDAAGVLVDAPPSGGLPGGTGRTFDWGRVPANLPVPARAFRRAVGGERRRGDPPGRAVGGRRVLGRRGARRRRCAVEGNQGRGAHRRVHRRGTPC